MNKMAKDDEALCEITSLLHEYKLDPIKWKYIYTFDTHNKSWHYLDGMRKIPKR